MEKKLIVNKSDDLFKEAQTVGARVGALGAIVQKDREITVKEAHDFFDRCNSAMQELNDWSLKAANYIDACNAKDLDDTDEGNLKKAKKVYKIN